MLLENRNDKKRIVCFNIDVRALKQSYILNGPFEQIN